MRVILLGQDKEIENALRNIKRTEDGRHAVFEIQRMEDTSNESTQKAMQALAAEGNVVFITKEPVFPILRAAMPQHGLILFSPEQPTWLRQPPFMLVGAQAPGEHSFPMRELALEGLQEVSDSVMTVARQWPTLHVSINLEVIDQDKAGMTPRELLTFIQRLKNLKNLRSADIHGEANEILVSKIIAEFA
jgi:hypothetical protein